MGQRWLLKFWYRRLTEVRVLASLKLQRIQEVQWTTGGRDRRPSM